MHTEHLQSVRPGVVGMAWFVAVCVASAIVLVVYAMNLVDPESSLAARLEMAAVAVGFLVGGVYAGMRARQAPILHGVAMALVSMIVWFVFNLLATLLLSGSEWVSLTPNFTVALMIVQIGAAVLGARWGYRTAVKGRAV